MQNFNTLRSRPALRYRAAVLKTIHTFYLVGFAAVGDWSPPQPAAQPEQFVSVSIRRSSKTQK
jgi:hypothetical protein